MSETDLVKWDDRGIVIGGDILYEDWAYAFGEAQQLWVKTQRQWPWVLGAFIVYGQDHYEGDIYAQAIIVSGLRTQTLLNYASVYRRFGRSGIHPGISFSLHDAVRAMQPEARDTWLDAAEEHGWAVPELRQRVKIKAELDQESATIAGNGSPLDGVAGDTVDGKDTVPDLKITLRIPRRWLGILVDLTQGSDTAPDALCEMLLGAWNRTSDAYQDVVDMKGA
jgi:hypothetical protein